MPPIPPDYRRKARLRMAQGLHPAAIDARERMRSQPMQRTDLIARLPEHGEDVQLSSGKVVSRAVVERVKQRWHAALQIVRQMDKPPPGKTGGPPDPRVP